MNLTPKFLLEMPITICKTCKKCCNDVPTIVLDYYTIYYILKAIDLPQYLHLLTDIVIYEVKSHDLNAASKTWQHWFGNNLLIDLTVPDQKGIYQIAALPKTRGKCPFLFPDGCLLQDYKPLTCKLFPYVWFQNNLMITSVCPLHNQNSENGSLSKNEIEQIENIVKEYKILANKYKKYYPNLLAKLQNHFDWRMVRFKHQ
ncbi:MAG: hypothetical protein DRO88_11710 [Promethearchaeia archaeon]|nr:MAG: hypothetical protein DRO88_11710 [Candidatus Lokiarchaeia archaeon]